MNAILDQTFSFNLRQLLRWSRNLLLVAALVHFAAYISQEWVLEVGGISPKSSPYRSMIPERCMGIADRQGGKDRDRTVADRWFLRGRIAHRRIEHLVTTRFGDCFGYAIITGLHGVEHGAGFTDVYEDAAGRSSPSVFPINKTIYPTFRSRNK